MRHELSDRASRVARSSIVLGPQMARPAALHRTAEGRLRGLCGLCIRTLPKRPRVPGSRPSLAQDVCARRQEGVARLALGRLDVLRLHLLQASCGAALHAARSSAVLERRWSRAAAQPGGHAGAHRQGRASPAARVWAGRWRLRPPHTCAAWTCCRPEGRVPGQRPGRTTCRATLLRQTPFPGA